MPFSEADRPALEHAFRTVGASVGVLSSPRFLADPKNEPSFSGVFVLAHGRHLFITAKHCVTRVQDWESITIQTPSISGRLPLAATRGRFWATSPDDVDDDPDMNRFDLGLIWLATPYAQSLGASWISPDRMTSSGVSEGSTIFVLGYPHKGIV